MPGAGCAARGQLPLQHCAQGRHRDRDLRARHAADRHHRPQSERALRRRASSPGSARRRAMPTTPICCSCARTPRCNSIADARRPGGPPLVLGGTAEGSTGNDVPDRVARCARAQHQAHRRLSGRQRAFPRGRPQGARRPLRRALGDAVDSHPNGSGRRAACTMLLQFARVTRHPQFPDVPTARELAPDARARALDRVSPNCPIGCRGRSRRRPAFRPIARGRCRRRSWRCSATRSISTTPRGSRWM